MFGYIDWGRLGAVHGLDPYSHGAPDAPQDEAFAYMRWSSDLPSPYGPTFTLFTYAVAPLSLAGEPVGAQGRRRRSRASAASRSCGRARASSAARRCAALVFVGLNPMLLVFEVGGAHNDMYFMLLVLSALYASLRLRESAGVGRDRGRGVDEGVRRRCCCRSRSSPRATAARR